MLGDLFNAGAKLLGGAGNLIGGLVGAGAGVGMGGAAGGASLLNVAMNIFGGKSDDPWGMLHSPVAGHVIGAVGAELLKGDPVEERLKLEEALDQRRRRNVRKNYGLPETQPRQPTAQKYMGNGLMRSRGIHTPARIGN